MIKDYSFDVKLIPAFIKNDKGNIVQIANRQFVYSDILGNEVYDCVSPQYQLILHKDVVDIVKQDLIPALDWEISKENLFLYDKGAILFDMFATSKKYELNDLTLSATITAVNSYNRVCRAGIHVSLTDEKDNIIIPHTTKHIIYAFSGLVHKQGAASIANFKNLANTIPTVIDGAIEEWLNWSKDYIHIDRLKIMTQLLNIRLAKKIMAEAELTNITRFGLYQMICNYILNKDNMSKSGFYYIVQINRILKFMKNDNLFKCSLDDLNNYVKTRARFSWDDADKEKEDDDIIIDTKEHVIEDDKPVLEDILSMLNI